MIDKKQLIEDLLECVNDATDTQTAMTGMTMCAILVSEVIDKALILTDVVKTFYCNEEIDYPSKGKCKKECIMCINERRKQ